MAMTLEPKAILVEQISVKSPEFKEVLRLRAIAYGREEAGQEEYVDGHSLHFIVRGDFGILGALRVTCRCHGALESESFYPEWLLDEFGNSICAASRMCVIPEIKASSSIPVELTKFAWSTVLPLGIRIDVSKARLKAVPYYLKMGYHFIRDSVFEFERWKTCCGLIAYPANPEYKTNLSKIFSGIEYPCDLGKSVNRNQFISSYREFTELTKSDSRN